MCNSTERYGVLEEYLRLGESERAEKSRAWRAAIGLQDVDGLPTSDYLLLGRQAELKNRYLHIDNVPASIRLIRGRACLRAPAGRTVLPLTAASTSF